MAKKGVEEPLLVAEKVSGDEEENDVEEIESCGDFFKYAVKENRKLWSLAGPAIFTSIAQYSLGAITQVFAGHLTTLELDAVSTENIVIAGIAFGTMLGMGSALETLCGQAFGAKQLSMLGIYMQRSWVILVATCVCLLPLYLFASPILYLLGQDRDIADLAGTFSIYMIPQLIAYGFNFPMQKFLQAQSKVVVMAVISAVALAMHLMLSWVLIVQFKLGLVGAAVSLNVAWWVIVIGQFVYIVSGAFPNAWTGFSWGAFRELGAFARLSIASAIMLCLELCYYTFLVVLAGRLQDPQVAVAAFSICLNLSGWEIMVFFGFHAAISVRISNELGAGRPRAAKLAIAVVVMSSALLGLVFFGLVFVFKDTYGLPFTNSQEVARAVSDMTVLFALSLLFNSVQPVLTGVAVGAGWQRLVAYVNISCYYMVGLPLGFLLGSCFNLGVKGIWSGLVTGVVLQTLVLFAITLKTDWKHEAKLACSRIKKWGASVVESEENRANSMP